MLFTIAIISILALSFLVWLANHFLPLKICPICAGVSGTWIWLIIGYFLGYQVNLMIPAILMGGSVVGAAYQLKLGKKSKMVFIPAGFAMVFGLLIKGWTMFFVAAVFILGMLFWLLFQNSKRNQNEETTEELKKKMDKCC